MQGAELVSAPLPSVFIYGLVIAAATKDDNDGENDNPGAVVVEEVAKAVVIHMCFPPKAF